LAAASDREYTSITVLGCGQHGTLYLAQEWPTLRLVTIKVCNASHDEASTIERLQAVSRVLRRFAHPLTAEYLDVGLTRDRRPYVIRPFVPGIPIIAYCHRQRLSVFTRERLLAKLGELVAHAHESGLVHGGLTSPNVLVTDQNGEPMVKVTDFGLRDGCITDDDAALGRMRSALA
jgi:serine/threonine protein kinase